MGGLGLRFVPAKCKIDEHQQDKVSSSLHIVNMALALGEHQLQPGADGMSAMKKGSIEGVPHSPVDREC